MLVLEVSRADAFAISMIYLISRFVHIIYQKGHIHIHSIEAVDETSQRKIHSHFIEESYYFSVLAGTFIYGALLLEQAAHTQE